MSEKQRNQIRLQLATEKQIKRGVYIFRYNVYTIPGSPSARVIEKCEPFEINDRIAYRLIEFFAV